MVQYGKHRPPHIYEAGGTYFISARTVNQQPLFNTHEKKSLLRDCLRASVEKYSVSLKAWVIIDWHYHILSKLREKQDLTRLVKSFHGSSAVKINAYDGVPGKQVRYQYWDRFPRDETDYWTFFNYIHINPIKHSLVKIRDGMLVVDGDHVKIVDEYMNDFVTLLARYEFSSFPYYLKKWGSDTMTRLLMDYPLRVNLEFTEGVEYIQPYG